ncbi:calcium-dependent phosphotriesterase [Calocera cornea HHB12733]|uniref:Calcium-dependent phosphotriesterase n=1 Tax=Calocera cornea HHB12733 TaxID=1353952 RepID=A0A165FYF5_9BASI|nr:calcium-dependent phosphotriesterase [Calocera cornea HHB12733]
MLFWRRCRECRELARHVPTPTKSAQFLYYRVCCKGCLTDPLQGVGQTTNTAWALCQVWSAIDRGKALELLKSLMMRVRGEMGSEQWLLQREEAWQRCARDHDYVKPVLAIDPVPSVFPAFCDPSHTIFPSSPLTPSSPSPSPPIMPPKSSQQAREPSFAGVITISVLFFAVLGGAYVSWFGPLLRRFGMVPWRYADSFNNGQCKRVEGLEACEKIIWHTPSTTLYLACSSLESRLGWTPSMDHLDSSKRSASDTFFTYSPVTGLVTRLRITGYPYPGMGISMHGFSLVPSAEDPDTLWAYVVNHRIPREGGARDKGADSTIEVLRVKVGGEEAEWVRTLQDGGAVLSTPNDVLGGPTGEWAYFTNEYSVKIGLARLGARLGLPVGAGYIGFCDINKGCSIAAPDVPGPNGIARGKDGKVWVSASFHGDVRAYEEVRLGELKEVDRVVLDRYEDNVSVDDNGDMFVATFPRATDFKHLFESSGRGRSPSTVHRIYPNASARADPAAKSQYAAEQFFADDGREASGVTTAEHWVEGRMLFVHGHISKHLLVCTF